eukprot:gi/632979947/ref/XP_007906755.1/ PREDICTED: rab11 family-interacting protein 5 [Callorhinchus milii]
MGRWYKLHSKPGEKEKERGEIEVSMQFVRNHLTASLLDLSSKEKPRSALGKIKDKMRGKKKRDSLTSDTASAIVPASAAVPGASEEESSRDLPSTKSKSRGFFFKSKVRKSSLTMSNSSLNSEQSARSLESPGPGSPGSPRDTSPTSPKDTAPTKAMAVLSIQHSPARNPGQGQSAPKTLTHKRALSDELSRSDPALEHQSLAPRTSLLSRSSLCVNGSHVYSEEPLPALASGLFPNTSILSRSLQNITKKPPEPTLKPASPPPEKLAYPRWTGTESRPVLPVITVDAGGLAEGSGGGSGRGARPVHAAIPLVTATSEAGQRQRGNVSPALPRLSPSVTRKSDPIQTEKTKVGGWFQKDTGKTLSLEVSPTVETSSDAPSPSPHSPPDPLTPHSPLPPTPPSTSPGGRFNINPFTASQDGISPSPRPLTNPFLSSLHTNPFYEDLLASHLIKSPPSARSFSSFSFGSRVRGESLPSRSSIIPEGLDPLAPGYTRTESWTEAQGSPLVIQEVFFTEADHGSASEGGLNAESWVKNATSAARQEAEVIQQEHKVIPEEQKINLTRQEQEEIPQEQEVFPIEQEVERRQSVLWESRHDANAIDLAPVGEERNGRQPIESSPASRPEAIIVNENGAVQTENDSVNMALVFPNLVSSSTSQVALGTGAGLPSAGKGGFTGGETSPEGTCVTSEMMEETRDMDSDWLTVKQEVGAVEQEVGGAEQEVGGAEQEVGAAEQEVGGVEQEVGAEEEEVGAVGQEVGAQEQEVAPVEQEVAPVEQEAVELMSTPPPPIHPRLLVVAPIGGNASSGGAAVAASSSSDEGDRLSDKWASPRLQVITVDEQNPGIDVDPSRGGLAELGCNEHYKTCTLIPSGKGSDLWIQDWNPDSLHGSHQSLSPGLGSTAHEPQLIRGECSPGVNCVGLWGPVRGPSSSLVYTSPASELPFITGVEEQSDQVTASHKELSRTSRARTMSRDCRGRGLAGQEGDILALPAWGQVPPGMAGRGEAEDMLEGAQEKEPSAVRPQPEPSSHCSKDPRAKNGQEGTCNAPAAKSTIVEETSFAVDHREIHQQRMSFHNVPEPSATPCAMQSQEPPQGPWPLTISTPHPAALTNTRVTNLPSPILCPLGVAAPSAEPVCLSSPLLSTGWKMSAVTVLPQETQPASGLSPQRITSPHLVKPLDSAVPDSAVRWPLWPGIGSTLSSGLERLRTATSSSIAPVRPANPLPKGPEGEKESEPEDSAALYYHLTHDELIRKILDQDSELRSRREQLRDLENYIDHLLVQIMETSPAILQVPAGKSKTAKR